MTNEKASTAFTKYVKEEVSTPNKWVGADAKVISNIRREYPHYIMSSGATVVMEWAHKERNEIVNISIIPNETHPFGVDVEVDDGLYHGHGAKTLDGAIEAASVAMYMLNHSAGSRCNTVKNADDQETISNLKEQVGSLQQRNTQLKNKNKMLRSQMNTLVETTTSGYDKGDYRNMITRPQLWRPPTHQELIRLAEHLDRNRFGNDVDVGGDISNKAEDVVKGSYLIVLDNRRSQVTRTEDKLLFMQQVNAGAYGVFLFSDEDQTVKTVEQRPQFTRDYYNENRVVTFNYED